MPTLIGKFGQPNGPALAAVMEMAKLRAAFLEGPLSKATPTKTFEPPAPTELPKKTGNGDDKGDNYPDKGEASPPTDPDDGPDDDEIGFDDRL